MTQFKKTLSRFSKDARLAFRFLPSRFKALFIILAIFFTGCALCLVWRANNSFMVEVPAKGGALTEGIIGSVHFINPLLAVSDVDRDMTMLVYSGLTRLNPAGNYEPDLAESFSVSEDKLTYTFQLRKNLTWHDGKPLTAGDVIFTIEKAIEPGIKSPKRT